MFTVCNGRWCARFEQRSIRPKLPYFQSTQTAQDLHVFGAKLKSIRGLFSRKIVIV